MMVEIPNRSLFRQPEVCELAQVQPYVLRSWEAEFPDLGVAKTNAHLTKYDSAHGAFPLPVSVDGDSLVVGGDRI